MNGTQKQEKEMFKTISEIVKRASKMAGESGFDYPVLDATMDITAVHENGNALRLNDLLKADDTNFAHDVFGIRSYLDRETKKLTNCFSPRYSI